MATQIPIAPGDEYRSVLMEQRGLDNPPIFIFKALTARQQRELATTPEKVGQMPDTAGFDLVFDSLQKYLIGWENIGVEFDSSLLMDFVNYTQALELLAMQVVQPPSMDYKKKSKSPSPSSGDSSVSDASGPSASESSQSMTAGHSPAQDAEVMVATGA